MKAAIRKHGSRALDRRTSLSKSLDRWRDELVSDLGGTEQVSTQQRAIINVAVKTKLLLDSIDAWLLQQPSLINHRKRSVHPAVTQRTQLADSLIKSLSLLGLEKKSRPPLSLSDYLNGSKATPQTPANTKEEEATPPLSPST